MRNPRLPALWFKHIILQIDNKELEKLIFIEFKQDEYEE
jgi:hypothetical protein